METNYENKYTLVPAQEPGVLDLYKNGKQALCRLVPPIPVATKIATNEKSYSMQFMPCNTTCPNCNLEQATDKEGNKSDVIKITCGAGYMARVFFQEAAAETPVLKLT